MRSKNVEQIRNPLVKLRNKQIPWRRKMMRWEHRFFYVGNEVVFLPVCIKHSMMEIWMAADDVKRRNIRGINIPCLRMNSVDYTFKLNHICSTDIVIWGFLYIQYIRYSDLIRWWQRQSNVMQLILLKVRYDVIKTWDIRKSKIICEIDEIYHLTLSLLCILYRIVRDV